MNDAFNMTLEALSSGHGAILATVVGTSGSTPASALARMLVGGTGERLAGTIGGGCIEADVILAARDIAVSGKSAVMTFTLDEDHIENSMLCGGTLDVFIERLSDRDRPFIESLLERRNAGEDSIRGTLIGADGAILDRFLIPLPLAAIPPGPPEHWPGQRGDLMRLFRGFPGGREVLAAVLEDVSRRGVVARIPAGEGRLILELVAGMLPLYIFGGGHVSRALSKIAAIAGFSVTVIDDRPEYANAVRFPEAARTIASDFVESFKQISPGPSSSIVIVTRGHKADEQVLGAAVATQAGYIGMIGSRKKVAATFEHLLARGVPPEALRRVRTPVGLDIGAVTPEEIAVSIVAEMIHARRSPHSPLRFMSDPSPT
jgi:xanthine dehydrogenase accessory factor